MKVLARLHREEVLDLLSERLACERATVRVYESLHARARRTMDRLVARSAPLLARIRQQEHEHAVWVEEQIRDLGGDPATIGPRAQLVAEELAPIERIVTDARSPLTGAFSALLAFEHVDHSGWFVLLNLAAEAKDDEAQEALRSRMNDENEHLSLVRTIVLALARREVLELETDVRRKAA